MSDLCYNNRMTNFKLKLLIHLAALSAGTLLISNLAAIKLWDFFGIAVDGGIVVFPLTYIIGDLIVELYGKKIARSVILSSFMINILAIVVFYVVIALPAYEGWDMQTAYASVLGFTPRIILASLVAYVCSNLFNNHVFMRLKNGTGLFAKSFISRALGSSAFAHIIDTIIFETIAFLGVLPLSAFIAQASFAYILGFAFEIILAPIEVLTVRKLKGRITDEKL